MRTKLTERLAVRRAFDRKRRYAGNQMGIRERWDERTDRSWAVLRRHGKETFLASGPGGNQACCSCPSRLLEPGVEESMLAAAGPQLSSAEERPPPPYRNTCPGD